MTKQLITTPDQFKQYTLDPEHIVAWFSNFAKEWNILDVMTVKAETIDKYMYTNRLAAFPIEHEVTHTVDTGATDG